jgi:hypothetical protein
MEVNLSIMGRRSTGAFTVNQCLQIKVKPFINYIPKESHFLNGSISWSTGAAISFTLTKNNFGLNLVFNYTKTIECEKRNINYSVNIESLPSNLGKGEVYFFICPFTFKRCKVLYMGYGSLYFKSRKAYKNRIYYASQLSSRLDKHNDKYWSLERSLEKLYIQHPKTHYRGKITHAQKRINSLENKRDYYDQMRWTILPKSLMHLLNLEVGG